MGGQVVVGLILTDSLMAYLLLVVGVKLLHWGVPLVTGRRGSGSNFDSPMAYLLLLVGVKLLCWGIPLVIGR